jgi:hypothetical protein
MRDHGPFNVQERLIARCELDQLLGAEPNAPTEEVRSAIINWHMQAVEAAVNIAWIPGMSGRQGTVVEEALARFHSHQVKSTVKRLSVENAELRLRVLNALECISFYASGGSDAGMRAKQVLACPAGQPGYPGSPDGPALPNDGEASRINDRSSLVPQERPARSHVPTLWD